MFKRQQNELAYGKCVTVIKRVLLVSCLKYKRIDCMWYAGKTFLGLIGNYQSCSYATLTSDWLSFNVQFIVADNIKICCLIVQALRSARSHFNLSLFITPTEKPTVKMLFDKKENLKITRKPVYVAVLTTVSMQEFISLLTKLMKTDSTLGKSSILRHLYL